jgi:hypothetical protein
MKIEYEDMEWIYLTYDMVQWQDDVRSETRLRILRKDEGNLYQL